MATIIKYVCDCCGNEHKKEELTTFYGTEQPEAADLCHDCKKLLSASPGDRDVLVKITRYQELSTPIMV